MNNVAPNTDRFSKNSLSNFPFAHDKPPFVEVPNDFPLPSNVGEIFTSDGLDYRATEIIKPGCDVVAVPISERPPLKVVLLSGNPTLGELMRHTGG